MVNCMTSALAHIGQGMHKIAAERRLHILTAFSTTDKAKKTLSKAEKTIAEDESSALFGEKFCEEQ